MKKWKHDICRHMFFRVLWPSLISAVTLSAADIADAVVVGNKLSETGLMVIGIVTPIYMLCNFVGYGFSMGGAVTFSYLTATGKEEEARTHFRTLALMILGIGALAAAAGILLLGPLLNLLGADAGRPDLVRMCGEYCRPLIMGLPVILLNYLAYDFVRCDDDAPLATLGFCLGCMTDVGLNILFVLKLGMGVRGSALATVAGQSVSVIVILLHLFNRRGVLSVKSLLSFRLDSFRTVLHSLRIGMFSSVRYLFQFLFLLLGNRLLLRAGSLGLIDGDLYVAVFDVVMNISYVLYAVYQAFSDTMQPLASTFSAEHDLDNLGALLRMALGTGLTVGILCAGAIALWADPVSRFFGLSGEALAVSMPAIRLFCLSTPTGGILIILTGFFQSSRRETMAGVATLLRKAVFLILVTAVVGLLYPQHFWWLFLISENCALLTLRIITRNNSLQKMEKGVPVYSTVMDNRNHDVKAALEGVEGFCEAQQVPARQAMLIQLAVEELCMITIQKAFTGKPHEYIQLTLARELSGDYVLFIRNSAPYFNPLDLRMERVKLESQEDVMDSIGVMMVRRKVQSLRYRTYEGYNVMSVII